MSGREAWREHRARLETNGRRMSVLGPRRRPLWSPVVKAAGHAAALTGLARLTRRTVDNPALSTRDVPCAGLPPALDGFTILHLSDLHLETLPELAATVAARIAGLTPDTVVLTGDYQVLGDTEPVRVATLMRPIVEAIRVRERIFAVLGNHDSHRVVEPLERLGIRILINEHVTLRHGDADVHVAGVDDPHAFYTEAAEHALAAVPPGFRLLLAHTVDLASTAAAHGFDLYLAGHTHGGQVCLPGGRPLLTGLDTHRAFASGAWRLGAMQGYTSRGAGSARLLLRINCPPEITVHRLRLA